MYNKAYIEIINYCNLDCDFCPKTTRKKQMMTIEQFIKVLSEVSNFTKYIYLHLLGEPTIHPNLKEFIKIANDYNEKVTITTNGTNLDYLYNCMKESRLYKVNISLTMTGGNEKIDIDYYIKKVAEFSLKAAKLGTFVVLRLWNKGGNDGNNQKIISILQKEIGNFTFNDNGSVTICKNIYIEGAEKFSWRSGKKDNGFCMGLKDQFGVLVDGTVVPCCIDNDGEISLGNIFSTQLAKILSSERATKIRNGFMQRKLVEERCKNCGFNEKF